MSLPAPEQFDSTSTPSSTVGGAGDVSGDTEKSDETKPNDPSAPVTPGPATTSAQPDARKRMEHCQEMSGDTAKRCQVGVADPLTPIQHRAVELLAAGMKIAAAARRLGIDERTIYRWKKQRALIQSIRCGCEAPLTDVTLKRLARPMRPKEEVWRFSGRTFASFAEYWAHIETIYPTDALYDRLQNEPRRR
jgi:hypothetical protein